MCHRHFLRVVPFVLACCGVARVDAASDTEPNDTLDDAVATGLVGEGSVAVIGGSVGYDHTEPPYEIDCVDIYWFEIPLGAALPKLLTVSLTTYSPPLDGYLRVFNAAGQEIAHSDGDAYPDPGLLIRTYVLTESVYHVCVSARWTRFSDPTWPASCWGMSLNQSPPGTYGTYDLTITIEAADPLNSPLEPNDSYTTATDVGTIGAGGVYEVFGEFIGDGPERRLDLDLYRIMLDGPAIIQADVRVEHLDSTLDPDVALSAPDETRLYNDDAGLDTRDAHLKGAFFEAGACYLDVRAADRASSYNYDVSRSVGYYDLTILVTPLATPGRAFEPNDSILEATTTGLSGFGSATFSAFVGDGRFAYTRGDVDYYRVEAGPADLLTVDVDAADQGSELDTVVVARDYLGKVLATNDNDGTTTDSFLTVEAPVPSPESSYDPLPATVYVMILGTRQARPPDPFVPLPGYAHAPASEHMIVGADSSTGPYSVTFTLEPNPADGCCTAHPWAGCNDPGIEACVCDQVPDCCDDVWHDGCVDGVDNYGCGSCPDPLGRGHAAPPAPPPPPPVERGSRRVFATDQSLPVRTIVELDPADGSVINTFDNPEKAVTAGEGLAVLHDTLFFLGHERFPKLYWLDPDTGEVLDEMFLWSGSGYYGDIAVLNRHVYVNDVVDRSIHVLDPLTLRAVGTLEPELPSDAVFSGPMASLGYPYRLYLVGVYGDCCVTSHGPGCSNPTIEACVCAAHPSCCDDEWDYQCVEWVTQDGCGACSYGSGGAIHVVHPVTGEVDEAGFADVACPCCADFDGDGDVDDSDEVFFQDCDGRTTAGVPYGCQRADLDCDGDMDANDEAILDCQYNGPDVPPNPDCCSSGLPPVPIRATALGGRGTAQLFTHDWLGNTIEVYDGDGTFVRVLPASAPLGTIGGQAFIIAEGQPSPLFGDCLTGPEGGPADSSCSIFDSEPDGDVDLDDFAVFQMTFGQGPQP